MLVAGYWETDDDGCVRPLIKTQVRAADGSSVTDEFLVDTGADRTVFSSALLAKLGLPSRHSTDQLRGIGGGTVSVLVSTTLMFTRDDKGIARVQGEFAAFTDPETSGLSLLGRDVLDNFDVIVSRRRDEVLLLAPTHQYRVGRVDRGQEQT